MEKTIKDHLIDTFDDLGQDKQKQFKAKLCDLKREPRISRAAIERVQYSWDLADLMVNTFTSQEAPSVAVDILKAIRCNEQAENLLKAIKHSLPNRAEVPPAGAGSSAPSNDEHFVDKHRRELIDRVNNVDIILDELLQKKIILKENYRDIRAENTSHRKMRALFDGPLESAGTAGKDALYEALKNSDVWLMKELEDRP